MSDQQAAIGFIVYDTPAPQGSKKFVGYNKEGHGQMVEMSKKVKPWREAVKWAALEMIGGQPTPIFKGPVELEITFTLPKPKSAPKRTVTYPDRKPDLDKLVRSTFDALKQVGIYEDDARVVQLSTGKRYPNEGAGALLRPGALIRIWQFSGGA